MWTWATSRASNGNSKVRRDLLYNRTTMRFGATDRRRTCLRAPHRFRVAGVLRAEVGGEPPDVPNPRPKLLKANAYCIDCIHALHRGYASGDLYWNREVRTLAYM